MISQDHLLEHLGRTDVYLLDQFMKRRFQPGQRVVDLGCGSGRNLDLFLRAGHDVWVVDESPIAIETTRAHAARLQRPLPAEQALVGAIDAVPLPPEHFDVVLLIAVLHFARDPAHWRSLVDAAWRALAPGGMLFARLTSTIGVEQHIVPTTDGRYRLGDGSERFLVTQDDLLRTTEELGGVWLEPVKTVVVQDLRAMTTWCIAKPGSPSTAGSSRR